MTESSPAEEAGLLLGDGVLMFDDFTPTKSMTLEQIHEKIKEISEKNINSSL